VALTSAGLIRVAADVPISQQGTYEFNGNLQAIDHILVAPAGGALRIERSSRTWRDGRGYGGSDHAALTSDFLLP
jgi:endonuclease/exonuclease/phosphatase family metal-dependent hydrolase